MILDASGKPVTIPPTMEIAPGTGRQSIVRQLAKYANPDEIIRQYGQEKYDEIARDPHVASLLQTRRLAVVGCEREIIAGSEEEQDQGIAEFVRWNFTERLERGLVTVLEQMYESGHVNGYATLETLWEYEERGKYAGKWVIGDIKVRDPEMFLFKGGKLYVLPSISSLPSTAKRVHARKVIHYAFQPQFGNPYGTSLLSKVRWYEYFKRHGMRFWITFLEKFSMPTIVGKYPADLKDPSGKQKQLLDVAIQAIRAETGVKIPDNMILEFMEASRQGEAEYERLIAVCNREISKVILGNTLVAEEGYRSGSYGLSQSTTAPIRQDILKADAKDGEQVMNFQPIYWAVNYNFGYVEKYPYLKIHTEPEEDLSQRAERDTKLLTAGVQIPAPYFYETYGYPEPLVTLKEDIKALPEAQEAS